MANFTINGKLVGEDSTTAQIKKKPKRKGNIFKRIWNAIKEFFGFKKEEKFPDMESWAEAASVVNPNYQRDAAWEERMISQLYEETKENRNTSYNEFKQDEDVKAVLSYINGMEGIYYLNNPKYHNMVRSMLEKENMRRGIKKIIKRYILCDSKESSKRLSRDEKARYQELFTVLMLVFNTDPFSFLDEEWDPSKANIMGQPLGTGSVTQQGPIPGFNIRK